MLGKNKKNIAYDQMNMENKKTCSSHLHIFFIAAIDFYGVCVLGASGSGRGGKTTNSVEGFS